MVDALLVAEREVRGYADAGQAREDVELAREVGVVAAHWNWLVIEVFPVAMLVRRSKAPLLRYRHELEPDKRLSRV